MFMFLKKTKILSGLMQLKKNDGLLYRYTKHIE